MASAVLLFQISFCRGDVVCSFMIIELLGRHRCIDGRACLGKPGRHGNDIECVWSVKGEYEIRRRPSLCAKNTSHTVSLQLFWGTGGHKNHMTSVVHAPNKEEHRLFPEEPLAPGGGSTNLQRLQGMAVVRQGRVTVWYVIYTVAGSSLRVIHN